MSWLIEMIIIGKSIKIRNVLCSTFYPPIDQSMQAGKEFINMCAWAVAFPIHLVT